MLNKFKIKKSALLGLVFCGFYIFLNSQKDVIASDISTPEYDTYKECVLNTCKQADVSVNPMISCNRDFKSKEFVSINGAKLRKGKELFQYANAMCGFSVKDRGDRRMYELAFQVEATNIQAVANIQSYLSSKIKGENYGYHYKFYKQCMMEQCTDIETPDSPEFQKCWKPYKMEMLAKNCENYLNKSSTPFTMKAEMYDEIRKSQFDFCMDNPGATFDNNTMKCSFLVEFRNENAKTIMKSKEFVLGEMVECAQNYFDVDLGTRKERSSFIIDQIGTTIKGVVRVVKAIPNVVTMVINAAAMVTETGANAIKQANLTSNAIRGGCFINDQFVAIEGDYFIVGGTNDRSEARRR